MFAGVLAGLFSYPAAKARSLKYRRELDAKKKTTFFHLIELWQHRQLVWNLTVRDLKIKYKKSWLGFFWTLLNPLLVTAVLISVFSYIVRLPISNYWAFLISGYFVFNFFSISLNGGIQSMVANAYLSKSASFPQEALIISSVLARFLEFVLELAIVVLILCVFHHQEVPFSTLTVLPLLLTLFLLTIGFVFPLSALSIYFSDAFQIIPIFTMVLFYLSPVFYNLDLVPSQARSLYLINPMALLLNHFHTALYEGKVPDILAMLSLLAVASGICFCGYAVFNRKKREFAEIV
jgi:ABC-2 type transport system permease protein